jgi:hypothetical protein
LMGFALPDDNMHAPNEKFHLPNFDHGIATSIWFLTEAAKTLKPGLKVQGHSAIRRASYTREPKTREDPASMPGPHNRRW